MTFAWHHLSGWYIFFRLVLVHIKKSTLDFMETHGKRGMPTKMWMEPKQIREVPLLSSSLAMIYFRSYWVKKNIASSQNTKCGWDGYGTGWKILFVYFGVRYQYDMQLLSIWRWLAGFRFCPLLWEVELLNARVIVIHNRSSDMDLKTYWTNSRIFEKKTIQWRNTTNLAALNWYNWYLIS